MPPRKRIELKPIPDDVKCIEGIESELSEFITHELFLPLAASLGITKLEKIENAKQDLIDALRSGRLSYYRGRFYGSLNSVLSKELRAIGSTWENKRGAFFLPQSKVPTFISDAIEFGRAASQKKLESLLKKIDSIDANRIVKRIKLDDRFRSSIHRTDKLFRESVRSITLMPSISDMASDRIAKEYERNMQKYIKGWSEEQIKELRAIVKSSAMTGVRFEIIVQDIQSRYDVGLNKAKFLARQETHLMTTKLKQARYEEAGVKKYIWRNVVGSSLHPVRKRHRELNGKVFTWDKPPRTSEDGQPPRFNHPGEDFNCRCIAVPIVEF